MNRRGVVPTVGHAFGDLEERTLRLIRRCQLLSIAFLLLAAGSASAQETTTGSITGQVVDDQGAAVPGATITITSDRGSQSLVSDQDGRYFAPYLIPGLYSVRVELTGFSPVERRDVDVRLGQRSGLDFALKLGGLNETIEVVGTAPVVDTASTTAGGVLDSSELGRLPVGRNFTQTLYLVPGVSDSSGVGQANPSISGASGLENAYVVDGVNITNSGFGGVGTYSIVFGSLGTGVTTDFIKETQVKTAGFEAEYGQATGGVVNIVTQSGSNTLHGSVFGYFSPPQLEADYKQLQTPNGTVNTTGRRNTDFGVTLSGPIVPNRLFFFGSFNPQYQRQTLVAPEGFPLRSLGEVDRDRRSLAYAGKLTWQVNPSHRINASAFGDPSHGDVGPQRNTALTAANNTRFSELKYGTYSETVRYDGIIQPNWLVEASVARAQNSLDELPQVDEWAVIDTTVTPTARTGGIGFYDKGGNGVNTQYQLKSTHIFHAAGQHQVRYGGLFEDISFQRDFSYTGPTFTLANGVVTRTGANVTVTPDPVFGRIYRVGGANFGPSPDTTQKYLSFFLQDTWQVGKHLTLRPGVRWERQRLVGGDPPLCHGNDSVPGAGDGTGAAIPCEFTFSNNWGPRIGATYDVLGNGKSKVYASYGRFFVRIPNDLAARALSADSGVARADYFDAALTRPVPDGVQAGGVTQHLVVAGTAAAQFDPTAKSTYEDEFSGGVEFEVADALNVGVRYVHRSIPRILEDYQPAPLVAFDLGCPGADSVEYFIANIGPGLQRFSCAGVPTASFEDPVHNYDSIEVTANKRFSNNWALIASYRYSKLKGNFEGAFRSDNGQSDPSITSLFDFPTNDPSYTSIGVPQFGYQGDIRFQGTTLGEGVLPNDRPHQFKVYGNYTVRGLNLGVGFNAGSGRSLTALAANPNYGSPGEIPVTLRGGGIDTVDGFLSRTAFEYSLDAHADYTIKLNSSQRIALLADAFNVFNRQTAQNYDVNTDQGFATTNPNSGFPTNGGGAVTPGYQVPRSVRLGARFEW
jgi:hypothetical protein